MAVANVVRVGLFTKATTVLAGVLPAPFIGSYVHDVCAEQSNGIIDWTVDGSTPRVFHWTDSLGKKSIGRWLSSQERALREQEALCELIRPSASFSQLDFASMSRPMATSLPLALSRLNDSCMQSIFLLADATSYPLLRALDIAFPSVPKFGVVTRQTPFDTGLPYTLHVNDNTLSQGAIGVAWMKNENSISTVPRITVDWTRFTPLGPILQIVKCQGNVILETNDTQRPGAKAVQTLLDSIKREQIKCDKDAAFYAALYSHCPQEGMSETPLFIAEITAGDPGRGFMSLATEEVIQTGWYLRFMRSTSAEASRLSVTGLPTIESTDGVITSIATHQTGMSGHSMRYVTRILNIPGVSVDINYEVESRRSDDCSSIVLFSQTQDR